MQSGWSQVMGPDEVLALKQVRCETERGFIFLCSQGIILIRDR